MSIGGACKAVVLPLVAIAENQQTNEHGEQTGGQQSGTSLYFAYFVQIFFLIFAAYLAWTCNAGESMGMRILYTIIAALFAGFYLIYYLIYHVLMGTACQSSVT